MLRPSFSHLRGPRYSPGVVSDDSSMPSARLGTERGAPRGKKREFFFCFDAEETQRSGERPPSTSTLCLL